MEKINVLYQISEILGNGKYKLEEIDNKAEFTQGRCLFERSAIITNYDSANINLMRFIAKQKRSQLICDLDSRENGRLYGGITPIYIELVDCDEDFVFELLEGDFLLVGMLKGEYEWLSKQSEIYVVDLYV